MRERARRRSPPSTGRARGVAAPPAPRRPLCARARHCGCAAAAARLPRTPPQTTAAGEGSACAPLPVCPRRPPAPLARAGTSRGSSGGGCACAEPLFPTHPHLPFPGLAEKLRGGSGNRERERRVRCRACATEAASTPPLPGLPPIGHRPAAPSRPRRAVRASARACVRLLVRACVRALGGGGGGASRAPNEGAGPSGRAALSDPRAGTGRAERLLRPRPARRTGE